MKPFDAVAILPLALALACTKAEEPAPNGAERARAAEAEVNQRIFAYPAVAKAGNLDSVMAFFADDARVFDKEFRANGQAAIRQVGAEFFPANLITRLAYAPSETVAHDGGEVVYQFGYFTEDITPKAGGDTTNTRSNYVLRWVKDGEGNWRFHRFLAVPAPDSTPVTPDIPAVAPVKSSVPAAAESVQKRMDDYRAAYLTGDVATIASFWADDVRVVEEKIELHGKAAIADAVTNLLETMRVSALEVQTEEVFVHDDGSVAYQLGSYTETLGPKPSGSGTSFRNHFFMRWKKNAAGAWVIDRFYATPMPRK